jgi:hypothetical protein
MKRNKIGFRIGGEQDQEVIETPDTPEVAAFQKIVNEGNPQDTEAVEFTRTIAHQEVVNRMDATESFMLTAAYAKLNQKAKQKTVLELKWLTTLDYQLSSSY